MQNTKKKVSLLTFNNALSYGAVLQTYALVKALENLNLTVEIIDFRAPFLPPVPTGFWSLKTYYNIDRLRKEILFSRFRKKYLNIKTKTIWSKTALHKYIFEADYYIVGSDQVWNPDITKKYAFNYFLDFVQGNKISYAASFGKSKWDYSSEFNQKISNLLKQFNSISVRENSGALILKEAFGLSAEVVLDPTLLYADFTELLPEYTLKQQIAAFQVNYSPEFLGFAESIQNKLLQPVYLIDSTIKTKNIHAVPYPTVQVWLRYIAESSLILTDSFHGVAFSIIYKKNFIVLKSNEKRFSRIKDLLSELGLEKRIVESLNDLGNHLQLFSPIDYEIVDSELLNLRKCSLNFLKSALRIN